MYQPITVSCVSLSIIMILSYSLGHWMSGRYSDTYVPSEGSKAVHAAIFALIGLLIAFSFAKAYNRFDERKALIIKEINAIATAYSRLDLLLPNKTPELRRNFKTYIKYRSNFYKHLKTPVIAEKEHLKTLALKKIIWNKVIKITEGSDQSTTRRLLIPALNKMYNIVLIRTATIKEHPPLIIFFMIGVIAILCAGITGYSSGHSKESALNIYNFALAIVIPFTLFIILDIEYPLNGLVQVETINELFNTLPHPNKI